jgi:hypothetical protein
LRLLFFLFIYNIRGKCLLQCACYIFSNDRWVECAGAAVRLIHWLIERNGIFVTMTGTCEAHELTCVPPLTNLEAIGIGMGTSIGKTSYSF